MTADTLRALAVEQDAAADNHRTTADKPDLYYLGICRGMAAAYRNAAHAIDIEEARK